MSDEIQTVPRTTNSDAHPPQPARHVVLPPRDQAGPSTGHPPAQTNPPHPTPGPGPPALQRTNEAPAGDAAALTGDAHGHGTGHARRSSLDAVAGKLQHALGSVLGSDALKAKGAEKQAHTETGPVEGETKGAQAEAKANVDERLLV
ncbi:hypothetical protein MIND_00805100 [Mycena indigotica]|uniref:Uncharacterized protein n=1 Tax=Mycena indigotica TaxID=2126181 RepID=A0A8H6SGL8_9AGAR|nr:uncharacterized protein MIND_00805100 [Mycena indigotica]KAF7298583.1 hypothetical protein MIND_00805100 [Mycena indigotica]